MIYFDQIVTLSDDLKLAFPVSSKHKAGFNVIPVKFRIIIKNIFKSHSGSQPAKDIENRDSCIPDAGFSESFFRRVKQAARLRNRLIKDLYFNTRLTDFLKETTRIFSV